jgi:hypothetical protein
MKLLEGMLILATEVWPKHLKLYLPSQTLFKAQRRRLLNRWLCSQGVGLAVGYLGLPFGRCPSKASSTESTATGWYVGSKI